MSPIPTGEACELYMSMEQAQAAFAPTAPAALEWPPLDAASMMQTAYRMQSHGGPFMRALASAILTAKADDAARICREFAAEIEPFREQP